MLYSIRKCPLFRVSECQSLRGFHCTLYLHMYLYRLKVFSVGFGRVPHGLWKENDEVLECDSHIYTLIDVL